MASSAAVKLAFYVAEPESGADDKSSPIIFLHGITACKELWGEIPKIVANASKRRAYVVDQRNHGDSEWSDVFNFDVMVTDILNFMDENKIKKAIIIGHSMGGIIGINTALKTPERVEALIVEDMIVGRISKEIFDVIKQIVTKSHEIITQIPPGVSEKEALQCFFKTIPEVLKLAPESLIGDMRKRPQVLNYSFLKCNEHGHWDHKNNLKALLKALNDSDTLMTEQEGAYNGPTSFIYGTASCFPIAENEPRIKKHFPKAELTPIEGASHNITVDCPEELTKAFLDFISRI